MFNEYLELLAFQESYVQSVQNALQTTLSNDDDGNEKSLLKSLLVRRVQKEEDKKPTKQISFELFKSGLSVKEVAKERSLTSGTVESHLASFIPSGEVDILELIPLKKYKKLIKQIEEVEFKNLTELKEKVDESFTFMELRMVLLSMEN